MLLSFKNALIPNNQQVTAFLKASGVDKPTIGQMLKLRIILAAQQKEGEKLKLPSTIQESS